MKKSKKVWIGISTGVIVAATVGTLLGVFIPQIVSQKNVNDLVENQVKPAEGSGSYLRSIIKTAVGQSDSTFGSVESFAKAALASTEGYKSVLNNLVLNHLTQFFKNFKGSDSFTERYKTWIEDINKEWDNQVINYKNKHGGAWEYYFQANVLDPIGGNEIDWKRDKLSTNVDTAFNDFVFQNLYVSALDKLGNPMTATTKPSEEVKKHLYSAELVNGKNGDGSPNNVVFTPNSNAGQTTPYAKAIANLQQYIFDQYVEENLPLVTSMTLYKHNEPQKNSKSDFFNVDLAKKINNPTTLDDVVSTDASYKWQAFFPANNPQDTSGEYTPNATRKYLNFVNNSNSFINSTTGAIEIPIKDYTDDSATLYYVKMNDVFSFSYTQYAAAANYKFNNAIGIPIDNNVPTSTTFATTSITGGNTGTEIMKNFMNTNASANGYFALPSYVINIINNDATTGFNGKYNGVKSIADSVNITNSPFIITRNEAGVHIIGIDRYNKIAQPGLTYPQRLTEVKNTILWRYILGEFGLSTNTGFTIDLKSELKTFFTNNRDRLMFDYILKNEITPPPAVDYIFSNTYTDLTSITKFTNSVFKDYIQKWNDYTRYNTKTQHKDLVKEKVLGLQSEYTSKLHGNEVINNGIAGILPYTRQTIVDTDPAIANNGVVDKKYGYYNSLDVYENATTPYTEVAANVKLQNIKNTVIPALYSVLSTQNIGMKSLTYSTAKYNQYLLISTTNPPIGSNSEFTSDGDILNDLLGSWISAGNQKNIIEIEKILSDINYKATNDVLDTTNLALSNSYINPYTIAVAPSQPTPTSTPADITKYINYKIQNSYDVSKKLPTLFENMSQKIADGSSYNDTLALARKKWVSNLLLNPTSAKENVNYIREVAELKYAFDYNETTGVYEFTKFRDYLLNQTANNKKAAYVWTTNERADIINNYKAATGGIKDHYSYKTSNMSKNAGAYGYAYQGAPTNYKEATGLWKNTVTFNDSANYYNYVNVNSDNTIPFTGFTGMQFETNMTTDLPSAIREDLFSNNIRVYKGYDAAIATSAPVVANIAKQGALYNYGSDTVSARKNYVHYIQTQVYSWPLVNEIARWFSETFSQDFVVDKTNITTAINQLVAFASDPTKIPDFVFNRNTKALLVNSDYSEVQPNPNNLPFYYTSPAAGFSNSAVITQFNNTDVIQLFDTNNSQTITADDKGINWTVAANGFLGSSADAFFMSAFNWYTAQASFSVTVYNNVIARQTKVLVYDRRLNTSLGKPLVENFKNNNTTES